MTTGERNVLTAAARAAKRTGVMLNVHPGYASELLLVVFVLASQYCIAVAQTKLR